MSLLAVNKKDNSPDKNNKINHEPLKGLPFLMISNTNLNKIKDCEAIVCDLDGTLYLDGVPFEKSSEFLEKILQSGRKLFYFTNNTSKSRKTYLKRLESIGFPADNQYLITAADCADSYLRSNKFFPNIYLVGNKDLLTDFEQRGYFCLSEEEVLNQSVPSAVVLGFDTELTYRKIEICYDLLIRDIPYVATHADILCPVGKNHFKPDVGSFISLFETATNGKKPVVVGKPSSHAVQAISERAGIATEKIAFIGDRLYTDMRMANKYNMVGILVLSGETNETMANSSPDKPQIIVNSIQDLLPAF